MADEPTGNLDEETRDEILALLERLWKERGLTVIIVTHDSVPTERSARLQRISAQVADTALGRQSLFR